MVDLDLTLALISSHRILSYREHLNPFHRQVNININITVTITVKISVSCFPNMCIALVTRLSTDTPSALCT